SHRISELLSTAKIDGGLSVANKFTYGIPRIITVPEPISILPLVTYAKNTDLKIYGWLNLINYEVTHNSSLVVVESRLKEIEVNIVSFSFDFAELKFVASGRADLSIGFPVTAEPLLKGDELGTSGIKAFLPPYEVYTV
ncbi:MAG: hypothetical protein ACI92E_001747, partial [Oceanicoccus sp.]